MVKAPFLKDQKDKKQAIARALESCISRKGYARTKLTDISLEAQMSPSHLRYYFSGGIDEILEYYFDSLCDRIVSEIAALDQTDDADEWITNFVNYYESDDKKGMRITMEIFGLAVHNPNLYRIKVRYDQSVQKALERFFRRAGCVKGLTPAKAASRIRSLDTGLKVESIFDETLKLKDAKKIVGDEMRRMCRLSD